MKEVIERRMEGMRGRGKPRIMTLDDIVAHETYEKIKRGAMDRECWRKCRMGKCLEPALEQNTNDDDYIFY